MKKLSKALALFMAVLMIAGCFGGLTALAAEEEPVEKTEENLVVEKAPEEEKEEAPEEAPKEEAPEEELKEEAPEEEKKEETVEEEPKEEPEVGTELEGKPQPKPKASANPEPQKVENLVYSGQPQDLVTAGASENGTVKYKLADAGDWSETVPQATNAGTYTVKWKVFSTDKSKNSDSDEKSIEVTIGKATLDAKLAIASVTKTGSGIKIAEAGTLSVFVKGSETSVIASDYYELSGDTEKTDVGEYTLKITAKKDVTTGAPRDRFTNNYTGSVELTWSIADENAPTVTKAPAANTLTYNGGNQALVTAGEAKNGTIKYAIGTKENAPRNGWKDKASDIKGKDAGTYYVWYYVMGEKAKSKLACIEVKIAQREIDLVWGETEFTYDGTNQKPVAEIDKHTHQTERNVVRGDDVSVKVSGEKKDAGKDYTATATLTGKDAKNYTIKSGDETKKFTIAQREIDIIWGDAAFTYNGKEQAPTAKIDVHTYQRHRNVVCFDDVSVKVNGAKKDAGENYKATAELTGKDAENYKIADDSKEKKFSIAKADLTLVAPTLTTGLVYNSEYQALAIPGSVKGVELEAGKFEEVGGIEYAALFRHFSEGGMLSMINPYPEEGDWTDAAEGMNAGNYYVWYRVALNRDVAKNYNPIGATPVGEGVNPIAKKVVTVKATAKDKMYDGTRKAELEKYEIIGGELSNEMIVVDESSIRLEFVQADPGKDIPVILSAAVSVAANAPVPPQPMMDSAVLLPIIETVEESGLDNYDIVLDGGVADILAVPVKPAAPKTGDNSTPVLWAVLALSMGIGASAVVLKKKEN